MYKRRDNKHQNVHVKKNKRLRGIARDQIIMKAGYPY